VRGQTPQGENRRAEETAYADCTVNLSKELNEPDGIRNPNTLY
jgi:hypothetical protein